MNAAESRRPKAIVKGWGAVTRSTVAAAPLVCTGSLVRGAECAVRSARCGVRGAECAVRSARCCAERWL